MFVPIFLYRVYTVQILFHRKPSDAPDLKKLAKIITAKSSFFAFHFPFFCPSFSSFSPLILPFFLFFVPSFPPFWKASRFFCNHPPPPVEYGNLYNPFIYVSACTLWLIYYSPFHKTLTRSCFQRHLISVRFYEMGDR